MKKLVPFCLCFVLICISVLCRNYNSINAADKKTYSVKVGKKITLKTNLKNAVWGSDDTSIATVSSKGVVKGVAKGVCTIVATAKGKSELFNLTVSSTKKSKKGTLYIGKNGVEIEEPKMNIEGVDIIFGKTTLGEIDEKMKPPILYIEDAYTDLEEAEEVDINTSKIYGDEAYVLLGKWKWNVFKTDPGTHQYYREMIISDRNIKANYIPFINGIYLTGSDYYILPTFAAKKAPAFDTFEQDILKKFSGYTEDNIKISGSAEWDPYDGSHPLFSSQDYDDNSVAYVYYVRINDAKANSSNYFSKSLWTFVYLYDADRKCIGVSFYYG
jgi:hypothetical protein